MTGTWFFVVDVGSGPDGKRRQVFRRGFLTKKQAQEELDKVRRQGRANRYVPPAKLTVKEYLEQWVAGLPTSGLRPSTIDGYRRNMDYVIPVLGSRRLDSITPLDLDQLYSQLLVSGRRQKPGPLSKRSVFYIHSVLHRALSDAVRKGILSRNVADHASAPSAKSTRPPEASWWTPAELRTFLLATAEEPLGPLFRVAAMTGCDGAKCADCAGATSTWTRPVLRSDNSSTWSDPLPLLMVGSFSPSAPRPTTGVDPSTWTQ
jgi:hypothetical protein